jgi:hypothetical protein
MDPARRTHHGPLVIQHRRSPFELACRSRTKSCRLTPLVNHVATPIASASYHTFSRPCRAVVCMFSMPQPRHALLCGQVPVQDQPRGLHLPGRQEVRQRRVSHLSFVIIPTTGVVDALMEYLLCWCPRVAACLAAAPIEVLPYNGLQSD